MDIGKQIKAVRQNRGLSQEELARAIGATKSAVSRYEAGKREPSLDQLQAIASALGVSVNYLLGYATEWVIIPGRLKFIEINNPESSDIRYDIEATDQEALEYGLQLLQNAGVSVPAYTPQALVLADMEKLNYDGQQKAVERVRELTEIPRYRAETVPQSTPAPPEGQSTTPPPDGPGTASEGE